MTGLLYNGFAGANASFDQESSTYQAAQPYGLWSFSLSDQTWTNLNDSASSSFQTESRPYSGSVASGDGVGYHLGGFIYDSEGNLTAISGLISYDFDSKALSNKTVTGVTSGGKVQKGGMIYTPNFGADGILVSMGGFNYDTSSLYPMDLVEVYDIANDVWYQQDTTGDTPESRIEFCIAGTASTNQTFDILVYAGWDNVDVFEEYDNAYILSLPSFHWFKADYESSHPRHALTCEHVGGGQILTIGGVDTTDAPVNGGYEAPFEPVDPFKQGLAILDMISLTFVDFYTANRSEYSMSASVQTYYDANNRYADFSTTGLKNVFAIENFTTTAASSPTASGTSSAIASAEDTTPNKPNVGAITGGVLGGVAVVAIIAGMVLFFRRRRNRAQAESPNEAVEDFPAKASHLPSRYQVNHESQIVQELPQSKHDMPPGSEAEESLAVYEASEDTRPHELG